MTAKDKRGLVYFLAGFISMVIFVFITLATQCSGDAFLVGWIILTAMALAQGMEDDK